MEFSFLVQTAVLSWSSKNAFTKGKLTTFEKVRKRDKIMRNSVEKCQTYPKIETILPQFETFLPLKSLFQDNFCSLKSFG